MPTEKRISIGDKHLEWVPVDKMRISPRAQRKHDGPSSKAKIDRIATSFDPNKFGTLTVSLRDGVYWIMDGGHRYWALVQMGWDDQRVQCWVYRGLTEADESEMFLSLNEVKPVSGMDKFQRALVAKRTKELDIDRIARANEVCIGIGKDAVACVGAMTKAYERGTKAYGATIRIIRDSFGMPGFSAKVVDGISMFVANYENQFEEGVVVERLSDKKGSVNGLLNEAERIKAKYGVSLAVGVAAATVETYNAGRGGTKLNGWWSTFHTNGVV